MMREDETCFRATVPNDGSFAFGENGTFDELVRSGKSSSDGVAGGDSQDYHGCMESG